MAYSSCVIASKDLRPDGTLQLEVLFKSDSGDPDIHREAIVSPGGSLADLSDWANTVAGQLNTQKATIVSLPAVGAIIPLQAEAAAAGPTPAQLWAVQAGLLVRFTNVVNAAGLTANPPAEYVALKNAVVNGYVAGYGAAL